MPGTNTLGSIDFELSCAQRDTQTDRLTNAAKRFTNIYGNAMLAGLPSNQLNRLQSVMNAAARLVFSARKSVRAYHTTAS